MAVGQRISARLIFKEVIYEYGTLQLSFSSFSVFHLFFLAVCDPSAEFWRNDPVGETKLTIVRSSDSILLKIRGKIICTTPITAMLKKKKKKKL